MEQAVPRRHLARDWLRSVEALRFGPLWLTLGLWTAITALLVVWCGLFGDLARLGVGDPPRPSPTARTALVIAFLTAFLVAVRRYEIRKAPEDWAAVRPLTGLSSDAFARLVDAARRRARAGRLAWDLGGAAVGVLMVLASTGDPSGLDALTHWNAILVWSLGANVALFVIMARAAHASVQARAVNERITASIERLDLLDPGPLRGFARQGLRRAFYWAGGSSIASLLGLDLERTWPLLVILGITLGLASFALVDPVRAVQRRVRQAKADELARVRAGIRRARDELLDGAGSATAGRELPGLLAYEARIENISEWPFDTPTLLRFAALAVLATASWLGGAVVERLLDEALG